jgi:prepilin peptidase CpaA
MLVLQALAVAMVLLATVTDLLEHKIYNVLTFPMMIAGILGHLAGGTWWEGIAATVAVGAPFFLLYATNILKAGDVKLFMAVGALLGLKVGGMAALCSVIAWAPIGIAVILMNREFKDLRNMFTKGYKPWLAPFGLAIAIGTIVAIRLSHET